MRQITDSLTRLPATYINAFWISADWYRWHLRAEFAWDCRSLSPSLIRYLNSARKLLSLCSGSTPSADTEPVSCRCPRSAMFWRACACQNCVNSRLKISTIFLHLASTRFTQLRTNIQLTMFDTCRFKIIQGNYGIFVIDSVLVSQQNAIFTG